MNFLLGPKQLSDSSRRWAGMQRFAVQAGIDDGALPGAAASGVGRSADRVQLGRGADGRWLQNGQKFTAIAAFDDMTAFGAIRGLSNHGLKVPDDCSVIGFDDVPMAELSTPSLTTIRQPMEHMGKYAAEVVGSQISGGSLRRERYALKLLEPELVMRQSTAAV